jgi:predicted ATPase
MASKSKVPPGSRIGPYEVVTLLGAGGMGEVYKGHDPRLGRHVAIKVLVGEFAATPDRLRRFELEARSTAALSHPNILAVYDVGTEGEMPYVVSEFLEGQTLREVLTVGPVTLRKALDIARQVASGLSAAHARGIIHRDLKPENIFLTADGRAKILDFGLAKWAGGADPEPSDSNATAGGATSTQVGAILGTLGYMAPEQATGKAIDHRCDQFAFGILLFEMLNGRRAFERPSHVEELAAIVRDEPPPLAEVHPEAPLPLQWILNRCLAKSPSGRYESTTELHRDLEGLAGQIVQMARRVKAPETTTIALPGTPLIGRETDVARAIQVVTRDNARLVTFTGPGGIGKTRLALQVALDLKDNFPGGLFVASLSTISDPNLVVQTIAQAAGVRAGAQSSSLEMLVEHLGHVVASGPALLIIDGFEHLLSAVPVVVELLKIAPLKVLVTSREPLHLYGEQEIPVGPLPRPEVGRTLSLDTLARNAAVRLFVDRATASKPDFTLTSENGRAIAEICNRLDGLPLAIELAAARVKTLPPAAMLGRLESRLQVLTGGARDLPARQQTLRGAIAWSHDLLAESEQRLFRRISVFVGGCTFEAAEAVADTKRDLGLDVIDGIESLVHKNLVQLGDVPDGEPRLTMMETIREFGIEKLSEAGEDAAVRKAHAAYHLVLAEEAANAIEGVDQGTWLDRLDHDRHNVRAALRWLIRSGNADWAQRLGPAVVRYWELREMFVEGREWLSAILAMPGAAARSAARAKVIFAAAVLAASQRDEDTLTLFTDALEIYRELGDNQGMAAALNGLAVFRKGMGDLDESRRLLEESVGLFNAQSDGLMRARSLSNVASILKEQGDYDAALARQEESLALFRRFGDQTGAAWSLRHLGDIARDRGDLSEAESLYRQSHASFVQQGDPWSAGGLSIDLGMLALAGGDVAKATTFFRSAMEAHQQLGGHKRGVARTLEGLALAAAKAGDAKRAITLAGAAGALRNAISAPLTPAEQREVTGGLEQARASLTPAERTRVWNEGWSMPMEDAVEYATATVD